MDLKLSQLRNMPILLQLSSACMHRMTIMIFPWILRKTIDTIQKNLANCYNVENVFLQKQLLLDAVFFAGSPPNACYGNCRPDVTLLPKNIQPNGIRTWSRCRCYWYNLEWKASNHIKICITNSIHYLLKPCNNLILTKWYEYPLLQIRHFILSARVKKYFFIAIAMWRIHTGLLYHQL